MSTIREIGRSLSQSPAPTGERLHGLLQMREAVRTFFYVLEEGSPVFSAEVQRLRAKYPEVWLISPLNGLTQRERLVLSQQGKLVLRDLRKVLHPGGSNYEN
jgi:hypothetical protein